MLAQAGGSSETVPVDGMNGTDNQSVVRPVSLLRARQNADGGFGTVTDGPSELESTALAAIGLADEQAVEWLSEKQEEDGSFGYRAGPVTSDKTGLVALALPEGASRDAAVEHLLTFRGIGGAEEGPVPHDASVRGWPWTRGAFGWTEPTAWGLLALRRHRPSASDRISDAIGMLVDRECVEGGWNYGNRLVFDVELPPFVQTTALGLLALSGLDPSYTDRAVRVLSARWRGEAAGILSLAAAAAALRRYTHPDTAEAEHQLLARTDLELSDTIALAWSVIATGDGLERIVP
jgi:hypothetical protein